MKTVYTYQSDSDALVAFATIMKRIENAQAGKPLYVKPGYMNCIQATLNSPYGEAVFQIVKALNGNTWDLQFPEESPWLNKTSIPTYIWSL